DSYLPIDRLFQLLAANPSRILGLDGGKLVEGAPADLLAFDPDAPWQIVADRMIARAGNTPFDGLPVQSRVRHLVKGGIRLELPPLR
ncbi:hypothetical protein ACJEJU_23955, partial [Escherichia coli]